MLQVRGLADAFPFTLMDTVTVRKPVKDRDGRFCKRRHWLIIGPPDIGKSEMVSKQFKGRAVYMRPNNDTPFEYGVYSQQPVIIYDDCVPRWEELVEVTNIHDIERQVPGKSRYRANFWELGQARVVIWLLNRFNVPPYARDDGRDERQALFHARFNILSWHNVYKEWLVDVQVM